MPFLVRKALIRLAELAKPKLYAISATDMEEVRSMVSAYFILTSCVYAIGENPVSFLKSLAK